MGLKTASDTILKIELITGDKYEVLVSSKDARVSDTKARAEAIMKNDRVIQVADNVYVNRNCVKTFTIETT